MKKTVLTFGLISGAISSVLMLVTVSLSERIGFDKGMIVGYTGMVLSFLLVYFGIRSYRDNVGNGQITFGKAFAVGICITLISCICYVVTWEIAYFNFMPKMGEHLDKYNAEAIEKLKASGASAAEVAAKLEEIKKFKELYANPLFNAAFTFIEPFPVGLLITLLSAAFLKKKPQLQPAQ